MSADQQGRVTMYKKEGCPFCDKAIELLENKYDLTITIVDIEAPERYDMFP
jgi:glutaredoxin